MERRKETLESIKEKFWAKVDKTGGLETCWWYLGPFFGKTKYGQFHYDGKSERAHRVAFELTTGIDRKTVILSHCCHNHICVNPSHLEARERNPTSAYEMLRSMVDKCITMDTQDCMEWPLSRHKFGYGAVGLNYKVHVAHQLAWEVAFGPIPKGRHVLHRCDNPPCFNPFHLFLGTHADNMKDMWNKGRAGMIRHPERAYRGDKHPQAKFTYELIKQVEEKYKPGRGNIAKLAREFGISASHTSRIVKGMGRKLEDSYSQPL